MEWKPIRGGTNHRCQALDNVDKRCRKRATWAGPIDVDLMTKEAVDRVRVELCGDHAMSRGQPKR